MSVEILISPYAGGQIMDGVFTISYCRVKKFFLNKWQNASCAHYLYESSSMTRGFNAPAKKYRPRSKSIDPDQPAHFAQADPGRYFLILLNFCMNKNHSTYLTCRSLKKKKVGWLVVLGFNATLTAKVISWQSVTHMCFLAFSHQY